jgi:hypothetical protein
MFPHLLHSRLAVVILSFLLPLTSLSANPFPENIKWAIHGSIFYWAADNGKQGADPAPILPSLGASAAWHFWDYLKLELTEDIYFKNYEWNNKLQYAMSCNPENRSALVMGFFTGLQLSSHIPFGKSGIIARVYGGPAIDIRMVFLAMGLNHPADFTDNIETDARLQTNAIRKYFWSEKRWFYPVAGLGMDFPVNEKFLLGFDLRVWFPLYRQWADKELPAIDGWRFGAGIRITPRKIASAQKPNTQTEFQTQPNTQTETQIQTQPNTQAETQIQTNIQVDEETENEELHGQP